MKCKNGHIDPEWYYPPKGSRQCRECRRESYQRFYQNNRDRVIRRGREYALREADRMAEYRREYRRANKERLQQYEKARYTPERRQARVRYNYNLSKERFESILITQKGLCAICQGELMPGKKGMHVDHDHSCCPSKSSCGQCVRGILCADCNNGLGQFKDDPTRLMAAVRYLKRETPE